MNVVRAIGAVLTGYVLYALASMVVASLLVRREGLVFAALALVALAAIGWMAGLGASAVAGDGRRVAGYVVAGLVALATLGNLVMQVGAEPVWYKVATLLLTVPGILWVTVHPPWEQETAASQA